MKSKPRHFRHGFTLIELLVVLGIVALLVALTIPAVQRSRDLAARTECASRLKQLGLAVHHYEGARRKLPEGCGYPYLRSPRDFNTHAGVSWHTSLLPYIEQAALGQLAMEAYRIDPTSLADARHAFLMVQSVPTFLCPTEPERFGTFNFRHHWALTSYLGVAGSDSRLNDGIFHKDFTVRFSDITDGTSNTLMIGERPAGPRGDYSAWYASWGAAVCSLSQILHAGNVNWVPSDAVGCTTTVSSFRQGTLGDACDSNHFWSLHTGGANFAFADGSVRFLVYAQSDVMPALATRAGNEPVNLD